jgi:hypothetical protein
LGSFWLRETPQRSPNPVKVFAATINRGKKLG